MAKKELSQEGITVKKEDDMPEWYAQVVAKAELADFYAVQGFMIIRPNGYAIWERIQDYFNGRIKRLGVRNAYFPLLIPESFFQKEAEHAKGFAPEVAWVTNNDEGERLAIRPTSETVMYSMYSKWVRSHRDLPLRINQWCNVLRWEVKQTKIFLRTREFLWQEGHCVYATEEECQKEVLLYLNEYKKLAEEILAIPVITGEKTEKERFAGAKSTYTIEGFMPDGKALQMGTSHNLGQGFAKAFGIRFVGDDEKSHLPWQNSWGFSTRLLGALVMTHGDSKGMVIPPNVAPIQAVIIPIIFKKDKEKVMKKAFEIKHLLKKHEIHIDDREEYSAGWKFNEWEMKGVPLRIDIGPKDIEKNQVVMVRRDTGEKKIVEDSYIIKAVKETLEDIQHNLFTMAKQRMNKSIVEASNWNDFSKAIKEKKLVKAPFCCKDECEELVKDKTGGATSRCIDNEAGSIDAACVQCGKPANKIVFFSKSY